MPRRYNRKLRRRNNNRYKKGFKKVGSTNKLYHNKIPRTLQVATRRVNSQMLRFVKNLTYEIRPGGVSPVSASKENIFLTIRANSIYDILQQNGSQNTSGVWNPQDSTYGPLPGAVVNADGYERWNEIFQHFTVMGSKIQATFQPDQWSANGGTGIPLVAPTTAYITLSGVVNQVNRFTPMSELVKLPYLKRAQVIAGPNRGGEGVRLYNFYSAKKFEGVKDVGDNQQLRGRFNNEVSSVGSPPGEQSFFNIGLVPTITNELGSQAGNHQPGGIFRVKVEYIVRLTEPTDTNNPSAH